MRILPVFAYTNIKNKKSNNFQRNNSRLLQAYDTVSFKANKSIVEINMEDLQNSFNSNVLPFINDSKEQFTSIAKIGYNIQKILTKYQKLSSDLFNYQFGLSLTDKNPDYSLYGKSIELVKKYDMNKDKYNYLKKISEKDEYKKSGIAKKIIKAEKLYKENTEIEKLRPFYIYFNNMDSAFNKELSYLNLKNSAKEEFDKFVSLKNIYDECLMYAMAVPYTDAVKVQKGINALNESASNHNLYEKLKEIEKLQRQTDNITEVKNWFYENKKEINNFIEKNSGYLSNTYEEDTILKVYKDLINKSNLIFNKYREYIKISYNASEHLSEAEMNKLEELVEKQNKVNNGIIKMLF